jgi:hypothetical protein
MNFLYPGLLSDFAPTEDDQRKPQGLLALLAQGGQGAGPLDNMGAIPGSSPIASGFAPAASVPTPAARPSRYDLPDNISPAYLNTTRLEGEPNPDAPAAGAVPAGPASFTPPQGAPKQDGPGIFDKIGNALGGIYGQGGPGDGLINIGLALASPGNWAENLMKVNQMSAAGDLRKSQLLAAQQKQQREAIALRAESADRAGSHEGDQPERGLAPAGRS